MADIFISYSKPDRALTEGLAKDLEARGHSVWWDTSLLSGETFREVILRELDAAKAAIVIWPPASVTSDWVISEATRARTQRKLITVRAAKLAPAHIPPPFDVLHCDVVDGRERIYADLGSKCRRLISECRPRLFT
jgi:TIR domain